MLDHDEQSDEQQAEANQGQGAGRHPAPALGLDQSVDDRREAETEGKGPGDVEALSDRLARLSEHKRADGQGDRADRYVDEEDTLPGKVLDEESANDRAGGRRDGRRRDPDTDGPIQFVSWVGRPQEGQRVRQETGSESALCAAQHDNAVDRANKSNTQRCQGEPHHSRQEDPATPEVVTELSPQDEAHGDDEQVGVGDPLQIGQRRVQIPADVGIGHGHDRPVDTDHDDPERDGDQGQPGIITQAGPSGCAGVAPGHGPFPKLVTAGPGDTTDEVTGIGPTCDPDTAGGFVASACSSRGRAEGGFGPVELAPHRVEIIGLLRQRRRVPLTSPSSNEVSAVDVNGPRVRVLSWVVDTVNDVVTQQEHCAVGEFLSPEGIRESPCRR